MGINIGKYLNVANTFLQESVLNLYALVRTPRPGLTTCSDVSEERSLKSYLLHSVGAQQMPDELNSIEKVKGLICKHEVLHFCH